VRISSYLDGMAMTPLAGGELHIIGFSPQISAIGQTLYFAMAAASKEASPAIQPPLPSGIPGWKTSSTSDRRPWRR